MDVLFDVLTDTVRPIEASAGNAILPGHAEASVQQKALACASVGIDEVTRLLTVRNRAT
jgi:hypothetical protein